MIVEEKLKISTELPDSKRVLLNVLYTSNFVTDEITSALRPFDITTQQFNVLRILKGINPKSCSLQCIQDRMISKMSNTTRLVDKLIAKHLVKREQCESNRRKVDITITEQGLEALKFIDKAVDTAEQRLAASLTEKELQLLDSLLNKLRHKD